MLDARLFELSQFSEAEELAPETLIVTPTFCQGETIEAHIRSVGLSLTRASILVVDAQPTRPTRSVRSSRDSTSFDALDLEASPDHTGRELRGR